MSDNSYFLNFKFNLEKYTQFSVSFKNESFLMKCLKYVLFFTPGFSTLYITTIGKTVYFPLPSSIENESCVIDLSHEFQHIMDNKKYKLLYSIMYLFPQILLPFALLAFFFPWFLLFLICVLPLPAPFRAYFEVRGFKATIYAYYLYMLKTGTEQRAAYNYLISLVEYINPIFTGSAYYFMWPFGVKKELNSFLQDIITGNELGGFFNIIKESFEAADISGK